MTLTSPTRFNEFWQGALAYTKRGNGGWPPNGSDCHWLTLTFDASRSSSTYDGTKLQPSALQLLACIRC